MSTQILERSISACENMEEFQLLMRENASLNQSWAEYVEKHIKPLRAQKRLTDKMIARGCGIKSLTTVGDFKKFIPADRKNVIMMAMMLGLSVEQTDELLVKGAKLPKLYSRNPEDAIWIYLLTRGGSDTPAALFDAYWDIYVQERDRYETAQGKAPRRIAKGTAVVHDEITMAARMAKMLSVANASADNSYREMVRSHIPEYANGYWRLVEFVDKKFDAFRSSANAMWEGHGKFKREYYKRMQALREERKLPSRMFLVALGVHLEMDKDDINKMLDLAGMAPLYAKDRLEASIVFLLEELYCEMPSVFTRNGKKPWYNDLLDSVEENGRPLVAEDERLSEYIARRLNLMELEPQEDQGKKKKSRIEAFLELL